MPKDLVKENGVIYTPSWIVSEILDKANYIHNIYEKRVIEPGCGDGAFLVQIVDRIIRDAKTNLISLPKIKNLLSKNVFGLDIDPNSVEKTKSRLNDICTRHEVPLPDWENIKVTDLLSKELMSKYANQFDFVFGNPPYVRIQNLSKQAREFINDNLKLCEHGSTDLYIAFFELGFSFLNRTGILGYITPSSYLNSAAGKSLRKYLFDQKALEILIDFDHHQVFDDAMTYSIITLFNKNINTSTVKLYKGNSTSVEVSSVDLSLDEFGDDNWIMANVQSLNTISKIKTRGIPLGELAKIHTGLATLKDDLFIISDPVFDKDIANISLKDGRTAKIEKSILKKIIKASTWKNSNEDQGRYIIFPYAKDASGKYKIIPENKLKLEYPLTLEYFKSVRAELDQRDKGDADKLSKYPAWYAFGRSQGIDTSFGKKIITASINLKPRFIVCEEEDSTYYAGYSIHYSGDLHKLAAKLNSKDMEEYIQHTSRDYSGGYKSYSKSSIKDFGVEL